MPAIQTNYGEMDRAYPGQISDQIPNTLLSRNVGGSKAIGFGTVVMQGDNDFEVVPYKPAATGPANVPWAITARTRSVDPESPNVFELHATARVMTQGAVWVEVSKAVDAGDDVFVTPGNKLTNTQTGNNQLAGARFDTSTTGPGLAIVRMK